MAGAGDAGISRLYVCACLVFWGFSEHPFTTPKLLLFAGLASWLIYARGRAPSRLGLVLLVWPLFGLFWAIHPWHFLLGCGPPLAAGVLLVCLPPLADEKNRALQGSLATAAAIVSAYLILQVVGLDPVTWAEGYLPGSFLGNPNKVAQFLLLALCLGRFQPGRVGLVLRALVLLGLLLCRSRGVWLAALVWWAYLYREQARWWLWGGVLVILVGLWFWRADLSRAIDYVNAPKLYVAEALAQPASIDARDPWFRGKRASLITRYIMWRNSLEMLWEAPLRGYGAGQFYSRYPAFANAAFTDINFHEQYRPEDPHNLFLSLALQFGVPWLGLVVGACALYWRRAGFPAEFRLAFALQAAVSMVSLNYLNPALVFSLILLRPAVARSPQRPGGRAIATALLGFALLLAVLDLEVVQRHGFAGLFPARRATIAYEAGDLAEAWFWQRKALDIDPLGSQTLHNLGVVAYARYRGGEGERWLFTAHDAARLTHAFFPFYDPARRRLETLEGVYGALLETREDVQAANFFASLPDP